MPVYRTDVLLCYAALLSFAVLFSLLLSEARGELITVSRSRASDLEQW